MGIRSIFQVATSLIRPGRADAARTDLNPIAQAFLQGRTIEGSTMEMVDPYTNHSLSYMCMNIIAQAGSTVPFKLWQEKSTGEYLQIREHKLLDLLSDPFPNIYADFTQFMESIFLNLEATGNSWILIDKPNSVGVPRSLLVLSSQHVKPVIEKKTGKLLSWVIKRGEQEIPCRLDELIHMKYTNPSSRDQILGFGPLQAARYAIAADFARQKWDQAFYKQGARLSLALTYRPPDTMSDQIFLTEQQIEQIKAGIDSDWAGAGNVGKVAIVHGGMELKELGLSQKDMDFIEGRKWSRQELAGVFRIPVPLLNDFQYAGLGREGVSVADRMLYSNNVVPKLRRLTSIFQRALVDTYAPGLLGEFDIDEIPAMRTDMGEKVEIGKTLQEMGFPINEINRVLDLGFAEVPWGDTYFVPAQMITAEKVIELSDKIKESPNDPTAKAPAPAPTKEEKPTGKKPPIKRDETEEFEEEEDEDKDLLVSHEYQALRERFTGAESRRVYALRKALLRRFDQLLRDAVMSGDPPDIELMRAELEQVEKTRLQFGEDTQGVMDPSPLTREQINEMVKGIDEAYRLLRSQLLTAVNKTPNTMKDGVEYCVALFYREARKAFSLAGRNITRVVAHAIRMTS